jgi:hypothetical protein
MNYDETKPCGQIITDLNALTGLTQTEKAIRDNAVVGAEQYPADQVMHAVVTDLGWAIMTPVQ